MKKTLIMALIILAAYSISFAAPGDYECGKNWKSSEHRCNWHDDDTYLEIEDGSIIIMHDNWRDEEIKITADGQLFINDEKIEITSEQQELLKNYHEAVVELIEQSEEIALKGAAVGAKGAALGIKAASNALALAFSNQDDNKLEREIEEEAAKIEAEADKLEEEGKAVEEKADKLDKLTDELKDKIDALDDLGWF